MVRLCMHAQNYKTKVQKIAERYSEAYLSSSNKLRLCKAQYGVLQCLPGPLTVYILKHDKISMKYSGETYIKWV